MVDGRMAAGAAAPAEQSDGSHCRTDETAQRGECGVRGARSRLSYCHRASRTSPRRNEAQYYPIRASRGPAGGGQRASEHRFVRRDDAIIARRDDAIMAKRDSRFTSRCRARHQRLEPLHTTREPANPGGAHTGRLWEVSGPSPRLIRGSRVVGLARQCWRGRSVPSHASEHVLIVARRT